MDFHTTAQAFHSIDSDRDEDLLNAIGRSLKIKGAKFVYKVNSILVRDMKKFLKPTFDRMFSLPGEWRFSSYSLAEFREIFEAICAIAHIHLRCTHHCKISGVRG